MRLRTRLGALQSAVDRHEALAASRMAEALALRTPADVLALLEATTGSVLADPLTGASAKSWAVGRLAAIALRAMEANNLVARVEMLEAVLKQRQKGKRA
jgi:hypothetical protein